MERPSYRPRYCVFELTLGCNLHCTHCGSSAGRPRATELSTAECIEVIAQLADLECRLITLSGGEPTLRDDWDSIARAGISRGVTVNMVTNGTTISERVARRMADAGLANVAVSLDGPEALHDDVRGAGSFLRAVRGLERLKSAGVTTAVLTHLDRRSAACVEEVHELAISLGARSHRVQLGKPMGELRQHRDRLLEPDDLLSLLARLADIKARSSIWFDVGDSIGYYGPYERALRRKAWGDMDDVWSGCHAGRFAIGIESDGGVKGCLSLQARLEGCEHDPFREGSLREKTLEEIWFAPDAFSFNRRQSELTGFCRRCEHARLCRGGAKCVSAAFTGRLGEDPYCYHRVAELAARRRQQAATAGQQARAALLGLGLAACFGGCTAGTQGLAPGTSVPLRDSGMPPGVATSADANPGPDVGDNPLRVLDAGFLPEVGPDPCVSLVYGVEPPPQSNCTADAGVADSAAPGPCCTTDYGVDPPPVARGQDAAIAPDVTDCANVCCACDYGVAPPPGCC